MTVDDSRPTLAIGVPLDSRTDLEDLATSLGEGSVLEARGLDGQAILTLVVTLYTTSVPIVITWIRNREKYRKDMSVTIEGRRFIVNGYTSDEVIKMIKALEEAQRSSINKDLETKPVESAD